MGLLRVELNVLHELFLRLRRERAGAVRPGVGTPDRVSHRFPPVGDRATLPPERATVNRLFRAALLAAESRPTLGLFIAINGFTDAAVKTLSGT